MRSTIFLTSFFVLASSLFTQPFLDPELSRLLKEDASGEYSLILRFKKTDQKVSTLATKQSIQKQKMESTRLAQAAFIEETAKHNKKSSLKSLWINNSILLKANLEEIREFMKRGDLESIDLDRSIQFEEPEVSEGDEDNSDQFTYGLIKLGIPEIRQKYNLTGQGVTVGLLDSGWAEHPDLGDRVKRSRDFVSNKPANQPNDGHGHGTHCLGTIGGGDTSGKSIGVAPGVEFIVGKIYRDDAGTEVSKQLEAMQWIADPDGNPETADHPRVISNSWGWKLHQMPNPEAFQDAVRTWRQLGIVPVFSAGNSGPWKETIGFPGGFPETIAIGATDSDDEIASFSSRGPVLRGGTPLSKPNIAAPGVDVYSGNLSGGYVKMSGTSMSAPHVAGVIALMLQAFPDLGVESIEEILEETAKDLGDVGFDYKFGHGRVDALAAIERVLSSGRIVLNGLSEGSKVRIEPLGKELNLSEADFLEAVIPAGKYTIKVTNYGFEDLEKETEVSALKTVSLDLVQSQLPTSKLSLKVQGSPTESWVIIHKSPSGVLMTSGGQLEQDLPRGEHQISVVSKGYAEVTFKVQMQEDVNHEIELQSTQSILVVNDDPDHEFARYYTTSLEQLDLGYAIVKSKTVNLASLLAFDKVIWFTGNQEENVLDEGEIKALETYLEMGGQLLLSGHGIAKDLKDSQFLLRVLGTKFKSQRWLFRNIKLDELKLKLNGEDSADNQSRPDVLEPFLDSAQIILKYSLIGGAGVLNSFGAGKSILLGFGLEGVQNAPNRALAMKKLLAMLEPKPEEKLASLDTLFINNPALHHFFSTYYAQVSPEEQKVLAFLLKQKTDKDPFRKLLFNLQNR